MNPAPSLYSEAFNDFNKVRDSNRFKMYKDRIKISLNRTKVLNKAEGAG